MAEEASAVIVHYQHPGLTAAAHFDLGGFGTPMKLTPKLRVKEGRYDQPSVQQRGKRHPTTIPAWSRADRRGCL
jgi:hypothetical protein